MTWSTEFGEDWDVPQVIAADPLLVDVSWHNDVCPSFVLRTEEDSYDVVRLWVDHVDPAEREFGTTRFAVTEDDGLCVVETDDPAEALAAIKRRAMTATSGW